MKTTYSQLSMSDGHIIHAAVYEPVEQPIGHIHILHGMAEHSLRYEHFASFLVDQGYLVSSHDHRGHGKTVKLNDGTQGFFGEENGFEQVVEDVREVLHQVRSDRELPPTILFGHSMGSFIARRYIQLYSDSLSSVIICGTGASNPLQKVGHQLAKFLAKRNGKDTPSTLLDKLSFGNFNKAFKNAKTDYDWLCSNEQAVQAYLDDPDCGFLSTNQLFVDLTGGIDLVHDPKEIKHIRKDMPMLLISGAKDPVGENGKGVWKVAKLYQKMGLEDVTVYLFEEGRHEILNETNREDVYKVIVRWLQKK